MLDYVQNPDTALFRVTSWIGDHIVQYGLVPFRNFLVETPWPVMLIGITLIALVVSGRRAAITTFLMLVLIGVIGEWSSAMDTASQVLVATVLTVVIGFGLGVWAAESAVFSKILRPINDVMQTLPQLVYLIPLIYLMPVSVVPGVIAGVLYAFPVVARLVESGVRNVEANTVEAAAAFGATRRQILLKVKIPLAQDAIMLGRQPGDHHGARRRRHRRARRLTGSRLRGRPGPRPLRLRARRARLARHTCARHRARPRHARCRPRQTIGSQLTSVEKDVRACPHGKPIKEGLMWRRRLSVRWVAAAIAVALVGALGVSASAFARRERDECGSLTMDENAWAGATANVYVLKYVLEKNLGCTVNIAKLPESTPLFQAMSDGKVDVVPEDWNNILLKVNQKYVTSGKVSNLGSNGVIGHIGWYIPTYLMQKYPQFKTWQGLKGKEDIFKSPESGSQGMFLGGDPSYVQKDAQLIKQLGLNFKFVSVGAEPAQVARWTQAYKQKKPIIFYWYTPQYLNTAYQLSEVKLPPRGKNCVDSYNPKLGSNWSIYKCGYGDTIIDKVISSKFAKSGSPAVGVIKRWKWTSDDQNFVANLIAGKHMDPAKAAEQWVKANQAKVNVWLGK